MMKFMFGSKWVGARSVLVAGFTIALAACSGDANEADDQQEEVKVESGQVVARVNGEEITMHQLNQELSRVPNVNENNREQISQALVRSLIVRTAMEQRAKELNLDRNPGIMMELQRSRSALLARSYISSRIAETPKPTRQEVDAFILDSSAAFADRTYFIFDSIQAPSDYMTADRRQAWEKVTDLEEIEIALRQAGIDHTRKPYTVYSEGLPPAILEDIENIKMAGDVFFIIAGKTTHITLYQDSRPAPLTGERAVQVATRYLSREASKKFIRQLQSEAYEGADVELVGKFAEQSPDGEAGLGEDVQEAIDNSVNDVSDN